MLGLGSGGTDLPAPLFNAAFDAECRAEPLGPGGSSGRRTQSGHTGTALAMGAAKK